MKRGTRLAVEVREGTWLRVTSPTGQRAWVSADVVELGSDPTPNASTFGARQRDFVSVRAVQRPTNGTATEMLPAKEQSSDEERAFQLLRRRGFSQ